MSDKNSDLIKSARDRAVTTARRADYVLFRALADALEASVPREQHDQLATLVETAVIDTVPREQYEKLRANRDEWASRMMELASITSQRDALAHFVQRLQEFRLIDESAVDALERIGNWLDNAPTVSLAQHDAEVWDEGHVAGWDNSTYPESQETNPYRT